MLKKIVLAGIISLSFQAIAVQAEASSVIEIRKEVVASGPGALCRDITVVFEYENHSTAIRETTGALLRQMSKTERDYRTTHRIKSKRLGKITLLPTGSGQRAKRTGSICLWSLKRIKRKK